MRPSASLCITEDIANRPGLTVVDTYVKVLAMSSHATTMMYPHCCMHMQSAGEFVRRAR